MKTSCWHYSVSVLQCLFPSIDEDFVRRNLRGTRSNFYEMNSKAYKTLLRCGYPPALKHQRSALSQTVGGAVCTLSMPKIPDEVVERQHCQPPRQCVEFSMFKTLGDVLARSGDLAVLGLLLERQT